MDSICTPSEVNVFDEVDIGDVKNLSNGGKMCFIGRKGKPLIIQTPEQYGPFGVNSYTNEDTGITKYSLDLSFRDIENRESLQQLKKFQLDLDQKVVDTAFDNSQTWFRKKYTNKEVLQALYTTPYKVPRDKETGEVITKYSPTLKVNLPFRDGEFKLEAYDKNTDPIDLNTIVTKGAKFTCLLQCGGVWLAGGKFGITWKVLQIQVTPPSTISGFSFKKVEGDKINDGEDDIDQVNNQLDSAELNDSDDDM